MSLKSRQGGTKEKVLDWKVNKNNHLLKWLFLLCLFWIEWRKNKMSEILDKIVALTENNKIIWHRNLRRQCYHARYTCGMHVIYISLDLHPFSTAEKRIVRFWTSHPNLLQSNFNDVGPFFDVSEKLAAALEKQLGKKLE